MAAVLPHLAQEETTTDEVVYWGCRPDGLGAFKVCPTPQGVLDQSHAQLLQVAYTRKILAEQMHGRTVTFHPEKEMSLVVSGPPLTGPLWNILPSSATSRTGLLSWTSKMCAPSFSLGAGSPLIGGSCPGAIAGQSVVPLDKRKIAARLLRTVLPVEYVQLSKCVCQYCYAEKGNYANASTQYHHMVKRIWLEKALEETKEGRAVKPGSEACAFVQIMIEIVAGADYKLEGTAEKKPLLPEPEHWSGYRFFRLHDSGDFFNLNYLQAWIHIAKHFEAQNIVFWAPTRIWTQGKKWIDFVRERNTAENLILRPSAYHINQRGVPDLGRGWAKTTVVLTHDAQDKAQKAGLFDLNCKAYDVENGPNCREAIDPQGRQGCRACWMEPNKIVNYTLH